MPHATQVRPRYPRIAAAGSAFVVTVVTLLGGIGALPSGSPAAAETARSGDRVALTTLTIPDATRAPDESATEAPPRAPTQAPSEGTTSRALPT